MERIQALIDKLYLQKQQNSNPAQLLLTVQLLQSELLKLQQRNGTLGTSKVAVTLPANMNFAEEVVRTATESLHEEEPEVVEIPVKKPEPVPAPVQTYNEPSPVPAYQQRAYSLQKPTISDEAYQEKPIMPAHAPEEELINPAFTVMAESPTLTQHYTTKKEVHEVIAEKKESLNDRLKQEKTEVVHVLKDTPIKDLRKGIGINDRFTFVNELFRGDDAMYERSIKTINDFHVLSEAEYWINRELKFKLGWNDSKETVQHFYHLVRRRFS
jgi:hypothetical protein